MIRFCIPQIDWYLFIRYRRCFHLVHFLINDFIQQFRCSWLEFPRLDRQTVIIASGSSPTAVVLFQLETHLYLRGRVGWRRIGRCARPVHPDLCGFACDSRGSDDCRSCMSSIAYTKIPFPALHLQTSFIQFNWNGSIASGWIQCSKFRSEQRKKMYDASFHS